MCKNPLKRKVASQFLNVLAQFLRHYQHFCKKKSDAAPKSEEGGTRNNFVFFMRPNLFCDKQNAAKSFVNADNKSNSDSQALSGLTV